MQDPVREVHVPPAQGEQLAEPQPGERGNEDHRGDQAVAGGSGDGVHLLDAQHAELLAVADADPLGVLRRVRRDPALALRTAENAAEQDHRLLDGPVREPAREQLLADAVDVVGRDRGHRSVGADQRPQVRAHDAADVVEVGALALLFVLEVAQVLVTRLRERNDGAVGSTFTSASSPARIASTRACACASVSTPRGGLERIGFHCPPTLWTCTRPSLRCGSLPSGSLSFA